MDVSLILRAAGVGFLVAIAYMVLSKSGRDEMAMLVSVAGVVIVLAMIIKETAGLFDTVKAVFGL